LGHFKGGIEKGKIKNFAKNASWVSKLSNIDILNSNLLSFFQLDHGKRGLDLWGGLDLRILRKIQDNYQIPKNLNRSD